MSDPFPHPIAPTPARAARPAAALPPSRSSRPAPVDPSALARGVALAEVGRLGERCGLELELEPELPEVLAVPGALREILTRLIASAAAAIGPDWGTVTVGTGLLGLGRPPLYGGALFAQLRRGSFVWVEVHSTGPAVGPMDSRFAQAPLSADDLPPLRIEEARKWLAAFHAELLVDAPDPLGAAALLLLPAALFDPGQRAGAPAGR